MSGLQKIVVLCVFILAIAGAYWVGSDQQAVQKVTESEQAETQIDSPSLQLETGPEDTALVEVEAEPNIATVPMIPSREQVTIYDGVSVSKNSTEVDLSGRNLYGSLKAEVRNLSDLQVLNLSDNNFTGLPAEVGQLTKLEVLDLSNNPFTGLPHELGNLKNLKVLDLRGTQAADFDVEKIKESLPRSVEILR